MKTRTYNILTGLTMLVISMIGLISIQGERVSDLTRFAIWAAVVVAALMLARCTISAIAIRLDEKHGDLTNKKKKEDPDELTEIAVAMRRERFIAENYLNWISGYDGRRIVGTKAILAKITNAYDGDGNEDGYWLCFVGTRKAYHRLKEDLTNATVVDFWPNPYGPGEEDLLLDEYNEEDESDDISESLPEDLPGNGDRLQG